MAEPVLSIRDLSVTFVGPGMPIPAVRGVSLDIHANEVLGIVGESGSGKSVASLAISGLLPETALVSGSIRLDGQEVIGAEPERLRLMRGRDVGIVFQDPTTTLNPVMRVGAQIVEGPLDQGMLDRRQAGSRAVDLLREVDIAEPQIRAAQYPHQLSGGMRQRAVIAMAMAGRPKLIIADEPTTALDVTVQAQVLALLARRQAETGAAAILITHDLGVVAEVAHRIAVMYGGRIVETGTVADIFAQPRHPYTIALLKSMPRIDIAEDRLDPIPGQPPNPSDLPPGCPFHPRCSVRAGRTVCVTDEPPLRPVGDGRGSACHFADEIVSRVEAPSRAMGQPRPGARGADAPLLQVENLEVHFPIKAGLLRRTVGWIRAVDGVSLSIRPGETLSLVGESGCGKTTTARTIMGLIRPTAGRVAIEGGAIEGLGAAALREVRRHVQYVFQDPYASLNPVLPVGDIVAEPLRIHGLYEELGGPAYIARLFEMVGLSPRMAGRYPREFSGGQKQRIGIARALALMPRLLILDEPVAALDVSIQAQIVNLLQDLQAELGLAYLFVAHDLSVVRHISDRVAVMYLGRIVEEGTKAEVFGRPAHPYTQALLSAAPIPDPAARRARIVLEGEIPSPAAPPSGCHFHPRCFRASHRCRIEAPRLEARPGIASLAACHYAGPLTTPAAEPARGRLAAGADA